MNISRNILKFLLKKLSRRAIKKHDIEIIVVTGWYGTKIAADMMYTILSEKYNVRRNISYLRWDFGLPLAILGYKDKRRNTIDWIGLIIKASIYLLFGKSNPHILILSANSAVKTTAEYWSSFIKPNYLLILNQEDKNSQLTKELISTVDTEDAWIIYDPDKITKELTRLLKKHKKMSYGSSDSSDLFIKQIKDKFQLKYKNKEMFYPRSKSPSFFKDIFGGVIALALIKDLELDEIGYNSIKFELPSRVLSTIKANLDLSKLND